MKALKESQGVFWNTFPSFSFPRPCPSEVILRVRAGCGNSILYRPKAAGAPGVPAQSPLGVESISGVPNTLAIQDEVIPNVTCILLPQRKGPLSLLRQRACPQAGQAGGEPRVGFWCVPLPKSLLRGGGKVS